MGERLKAGDTFAGTYFLKSLLGEGGMGQVWRALHVRHERDVALKTIIPSFRDAQQELFFREHFLLEAQVVLRLSHKNIVAVYDRGEHEGILYFTMQFVNGGMDMEHVLRRSPGNRLPWPLACHGIGQLLEGLTEAHRQKIVHRDVKPANLMVDPRGYSLLMDFGVAKQLTATVSLKTQAKGTDGFMPPDAYRGVGYSVASDIFSVGAMLRRMIVGTNVLTDGITMHEEVVGRLLRLEHEALPSIASSGVECPPEVEAFVAKCMAWEPRDRFRDASEAYDAFYPLTRFAGDRDMVTHIRILPTQLSPSAATPIGSAEAVPERIPTHSPGDTPIYQGTPALPRSVQPPGPPPPLASMPPTGSLHGQVVEAAASSAPRLVRRRKPLLLGGAVAAVGALAALLLLTRNPGLVNRPAKEPGAPTAVATLPDAGAPASSLSAPDAALRARIEADATPVAVTMRLIVAPADATTTVEGKKLTGPGPYALDAWPEGHQLLVRVEREGFEPQDATIPVKAGGEVAITLQAQATAVVEPARPERDPDPSPAPDRPDRPQPRGTGDLVIKTRGGAAVVVYLDGTRKGVAPLRLQGVSAGRHVLKFENDETNEEKRMRVEVKAGSVKAVETGW